MRCHRLRIPLLIAMAALSAGCPTGGERGSGSRETARESRIPDAVRQELIRLGAEDQEARRELSPDRMQDTAFAKSMLRGDSARTARLRAIVDEYDWPDSLRAGGEAAEAAFLILQHSPSHELQKEWLPTIEGLARQGTVAADQAALLIDRVLVHDGLPQRYGTQFEIVDGRLVLDSVENEAGLEARRSSMGLPSMEEYIRLMEEVYKMPVVRHR